MIDQSPPRQGNPGEHLKEAKKTVVGASRSRRDRARERDAPTTHLQLGDAPNPVSVT